MKLQVAGEEIAEGGEYLAKAKVAESATII